MASPYPLWAYWSGPKPEPRDLAVAVLGALPRGEAPDVHSPLSSGHAIVLDWPDVVACQIAEGDPTAFLGIAVELPAESTVFLDKVTMHSRERRYEFARTGPEFMAPFDRAAAERTARRLEDVVVALIEGAGAAAAFSSCAREDHVAEWLDAFEEAMGAWDADAPLPLSLLSAAPHLCGWRADLAADLEPTGTRGRVALWQEPSRPPAPLQERPTAAVPG